VTITPINAVKIGSNAFTTLTKLTEPRPARDNVSVWVCGLGVYLPKS
jgi:hypothetical protein